MGSEMLDDVDGVNVVFQKLLRQGHVVHLLLSP
jgi:hypothetical protein